METEDMVYTRGATGSYPKPDASSPRPTTLFRLTLVEYPRVCTEAFRAVSSFQAL
jgi:hypothetical protein